MSYCVGEAGKSVVLDVPEEKAAVSQEHTEKKEKGNYQSLILY